MSCLLRALLCSSLLLAGCSPSAAPAGGSTAGKASKGTIALSVLTISNPFFIEIADNMRAEAAKHGYDVLVVSGDNDVNKQQNQVKDFIVRKAAAIVLCPCDSKSIGQAILEAQAAGIPVFTADIACLAPGVKVTSHVATDNLGGGREAGKAMIEALGEAGGKIAILDYKDVESCLQRVEGFKEVIAAHNRGREKGRIEIAAELPGRGHKDQGYRAAEDAIQAHPDLAAIFAINDPSALGARAALEKAGKAGQVKLIGFDGQPEAKQAIKEGKLYASPVQHPDEIGRRTVQMIVKHFAGEKVPAESLIPATLYRKADADRDPGLKG